VSASSSAWLSGYLLVLELLLTYISGRNFAICYHQFNTDAFASNLVKCIKNLKSFDPIYQVLSISFTKDKIWVWDYTFTPVIPAFRGWERITASWRPACATEPHPVSKTKQTKRSWNQRNMIKVLLLFELRMLSGFHGIIFSSSFTCFILLSPLLDSFF
jgi:hypothetical protein